MGRAAAIGYLFMAIAALGLASQAIRSCTAPRAAITDNRLPRNHPDCTAAARETVMGTQELVHAMLAHCRTVQIVMPNGKVFAYTER